MKAKVFDQPNRTEAPITNKSMANWNFQIQGIVIERAGSKQSVVEGRWALPFLAEPSTWNTICLGKALDFQRSQYEVGLTGTNSRQGRTQLKGRADPSPSKCILTSTCRGVLRPEYLELACEQELFPRRIADAMRK